METPETRVQLILAESEQLGQYLRSLPPDAWRCPSAAIAGPCATQGAISS